jgi:hypothetical protein
MDIIMNKVDIASYLDALNASKTRATPERINFIKRHAPKFLQQMNYLYETDKPQFNDIYRQILMIGDADLLSNLNQISRNAGIPYNGAGNRKKRSMKRSRRMMRKRRARVISRK